MQTINWAKADAWIDSYISHITNPNDIPARFGRTWFELEAEKVGLVANGRGWKLMECHAAWYAALIRTHRLHKVNRIEKRLFSQKTTTLSTVRKLLNGRLRDTATASMLRNMILEK